ncbi:tripartite tricarboxylate transporter substrate binding protein [Variovorax dokdonensis]|uniref:Tripartite tricarboxylate transporter substrate binding protein n=1 Tax=Variovorax dokdonensis TaxID=344883 RepID=A0ABT7NAQ2_9BURK|nr:tripartite tricarboxylate transporter substrate binding protein [Variovorax dokdonensis]MDM0045017.1 tripartite tricarboxylate transporter substrate binding protein [Variovorax dokdonensis]
MTFTKHFAQTNPQLPRFGVLAIRLGRALIATSVLCAGGAFAQTTWKPDRQVTLVVPYNPGGGTDATARAVASRLTTLWNQPVVVENIGGADGLIGTRRVIEAAPDGYTLLFQVPSILLMKYQRSLKGIDPVSQLTPVTAVATSPTALVMSASLPFKTLPELIAYCKARPCNVGSGENSSKIRAQKFSADYELKDMAVVNYKGTSPIVSDLVSGNLTMAFTGITAAIPLHKSGRVRILVTNGNQRAHALPDVPTSMEAGWLDSYSVTWYGMFAPKGTPEAVTRGIADATREAGKDVHVREALTVAGAEPAFTSPAEFTEMIKQDSARLGALVKRFPLED